MSMKATAEQIGGGFLLVEELAPTGTATPLRVHPIENESFYILEGELTFYILSSYMLLRVQFGEGKGEIRHGLRKTKTKLRRSRP